ncbi:hypothetical protein CASFOL_036953 [Castilleja foliolosa]|uniref:Pectinesterase inhibitor domain-containing protein n=1 Tax=Castilleja foliolosa TaxID=1961234 RepID=A0ABD3BQ87_9LAMI
MNKCNHPFFILATIALISLSMLCIINYCDAAEDKISDICSSNIIPNLNRNLCEKLLTVKQNTCDHNDLRCMGQFVNSVVIIAIKFLLNGPIKAAKSGIGTKKPAKACDVKCLQATRFLNTCQLGYWSKTSAFNKSTFDYYGKRAITLLRECEDGFENELVKEPDNLNVDCKNAQDLINVMLAIGELIE